MFRFVADDQNVVELFNDSTRPVEFKREKHVRSFLLATISMTDIFFVSADVVDFCFTTWGLNFENHKGHHRINVVIP